MNAPGGPATTAYSYDDLDRLAECDYPSGTGVKHTYQYNAANWLTNVTVSHGVSILSKFDYWFTDSTAGRTGARTSEKLNNNLRATYTYDPIYRLTQETLSTSGSDPTGTITYDTAAGYTDSSGFDKVGNRRSRTVSLNPAVTGFPNGTVNSSYNSNDRLTSDTYDANGNTAVAGGFTYTYDFDNRLRTRNSSPWLAFGYDQDGNRVTKTNAGTATFFLVDEHTPTGYPQVAEELSAVGATPTLSKTYVFGLRIIEQRFPDGNGGQAVQYYGHDGHWNVRLLLDNTGTVIDPYTYDGFGSRVSATPTAANNYLYCGEQFDPDLGMYYLRARYYSPDKGRFWNMDFEDSGDVEDPLSLHSYDYCKAAPINLSDPTGHDGTTMELDVAGALAASLVAFTAISLYEVKTHAIGSLMQSAWTGTMTETSSAIAAAESALAVARTSVRQLIKDAKNILKKAGRFVRAVKVVPMPKSVIPAVANHVARAQTAGSPALLIRVSPATAAANRRAAIGALPSAGFGQSWDEYPFASGLPPGVLPSVAPVPWLQNCIQGGIISGCYRIEKITPGTPYIVVVTP
jgi:RHS repeat-associated protein